MTSLQAKVIVITGASAGIGKALAKQLVNAGCNVVGCARNIQKLEEVSSILNSEGPGKMSIVKCDVKIEQDIINVINFVEKEYGKLHAFVNNAGMGADEPLLTGNTEKWMELLQVNVLSVAIGAREAIKYMKKCGVNDGHIVNLNSTVGHKVINRAASHFYSATKHAVTALTEGLRQELRAENSNIRVTGISPGIVKTEFSYRMFKDNASIADAYYSQFEVMQAEDIAESIVYALSAPPRVNVSDILLEPTGCK